MDPLGQTTTYGYDALNRLTGITYSDGQTPNVTYGYDFNGNRTSMVDGTGTTTYTYDEANRLLSATTPGPEVVGYRYDLDGNRTKVIYPDSTAVTYTFDKASRLGSLLDWASRSTGYEYNPDGSLKTVTNFNGTTASYTYDNALRLTDLWNKEGSDTISRHTYALDAAGNRTQVDEVLAQVGGGSQNQTIAYGYDRLYRLTTVTAPGGNSAYEYDPVGNRLTLTRGSATNYTYDRADRITAAGATTYTVNANGNLTARGNDAFTYDQANRLKTASVGGTSSTYTYDGDGKRASKTVGGNTTTYVYDANLSLPVVLDDGTKKYVWGIGLAYAAEGASALLYHTDGLGSVRVITDASAQVVQTYETDEFGVPTESHGALSQPFGYTGEQCDAETGFIYLRARYYDPSTGRFISRDAFAGSVDHPSSLHRYGYAVDNPVLYSDPSGYWVSVLMGAVVGAAIDIGAQTLIGGKSLDQVDMVSVAASAAAGATGVGLGSVVGNVTRSVGARVVLNAVGSAGIGAAASAGQELAKGQEVDWSKAASSAVLNGGLGGIGSAVGEIAVVAQAARANAAWEHASLARRLLAVSDSFYLDYSLGSPGARLIGIGNSLGVVMSNSAPVFQQPMGSAYAAGIK